MPREFRYARAGAQYVAYEVFGAGPLDLVIAPGYMSNLEQNWTWPPYARFLEQLSSFARVMILDRRGTGLSDRLIGTQTFDDLMDDIRAVMDDAGSDQAAVVGGAEGGPMCSLFAATYPERTSALILITTYARRMRAHDYPWGLPAEVDALVEGGVSQSVGPGPHGDKDARARSGRRSSVPRLVRSGPTYRRHSRRCPRLVPDHSRY